MTDTVKRVKRPAPGNLTQDPRRIRRRRLAAGFPTVRLAAAEAGCSYGFVSELENGNYSASPALLAALARAYQCRIADLVADQHVELMSQFAAEADPDGVLPESERDFRAASLLVEHLQHAEKNGAAA